MAAPCCHNCVYSVCDPELWLRLMWKGEPIVPRCANHPDWPGQLHDVPGVPCRNYRPRPVLPQGDSVRMIPLGDGFYAYVDAADYEELSRHTWHLENGYAARREKGKVILMHREITQAPKDRLVDHIDANKANNCRFNLRVCTHAENVQNARKHADARSRFKGVSYHKRMRKWRARCTCAGREQVLGYFDDESEAARAYDRMAVENFGVYARVNFPREWPPERRAAVHAEWQAAVKKKGRTESKKGGRKVRRADGIKARRPPADRPMQKAGSLAPRRRDAERAKERRKRSGKKAKGQKRNPRPPAGRPGVPEARPGEEPPAGRMGRSPAHADPFWGRNPLTHRWTWRRAGMCSHRDTKITKKSSERDLLS